MHYEQNHGFSKASCLIVDDNSFNTVAIQSLMMQFQIECNTATDGNQAIHWVKQRFKSQGNAYKLIFLDYNMPECDGIEAGVKIKKFMNMNLPKKEHSFICCMTVSDGENYENQAKKAGMDYFLRKPVFRSGI